MAYQKALREKMDRLALDMRAIVGKAKNEGDRGLTSDERTQFHALEADYSNLEETVRVSEKTDDIVARLAAAPGTPVGQQDTEQLRDEFRITPRNRAERMKDPYFRAFSHMLRVHPQVSLGEGLTQEDRAVLTKGFQRFENTMSTTTGSQGGYVIPQGFSGMLMEAEKWFGGIEGVVDKFQTATGNPFPWPTLNDTANRGAIIGQNVQVAETDLTFGQTTFSAYIGSSNIVLIPLALIQDSFFDLDALVARLLGTRLGRLKNWKCTVGSGTGEPTGIVTAAVAAGNINIFPTGETAAIAYNDLVNTEHAVDPAYRYNPSARFMFPDAQLKIIKKLVDGNNRPLWQPGLTSSFREGAAVDLIASRPMILDHPYIVNQDMAVPAANAYSMLFGDMSTFKVREVADGITVMRLTERYADYLQVGFIAYERFDSNLIDAGTHPIAVGQNSAT